MEALLCFLGFESMCEKSTSESSNTSNSKKANNTSECPRPKVKDPTSGECKWPPCSAPFTVQNAATGSCSCPACSIPGQPQDPNTCVCAWPACTAPKTIQNGATGACSCPACSIPGQPQDPNTCVCAWPACTAPKTVQNAATGVCSCPACANEKFTLNQTDCSCTCPLRCPGAFKPDPTCTRCQCPIQASADSTLDPDSCVQTCKPCGTGLKLTNTTPGQCKCEPIVGSLEGKNFGTTKNCGIFKVEDGKRRHYPDWNIWTSWDPDGAADAGTIDCDYLYQHTQLGEPMSLNLEGRNVVCNESGQSISGRIYKIERNSDGVLVRRWYPNWDIYISHVGSANHISVNCATLINNYAVGENMEYNEPETYNWGGNWGGGWGSGWW